MKKCYLVLAMCGMTQLASAYEVHEWGTFTTVSGSNGELLTGLQVEEEDLPSFVYSHMTTRNAQLNRSGIFTREGVNRGPDRNQIFVMKNAKQELDLIRGMKGFPVTMMQNVTVKMETPVIYFYGDDTPNVNVKVGFNGGTISQWYPQRLTGDTPNLLKVTGEKMSEKLRKTIGSSKDAEMVMFKPIDFSKSYQGGIEWDVEVLPKSEADDALTFKPDENHAWIYPRVKDANMVKVGDEYEDYLFYRGVGNFQIPVTFSVDESETLIVSNKSEEAVPFAFAFENLHGIVRYKVIGEVAAGETAKVAESEWVVSNSEKANQFPRVHGSVQHVKVFQEMRKGLVAQGLTVDEANGMVKTWWRSYFDKPGLRVFWIVPPAELEKTLPLTLTPAPEKTVRVMVGRADVLRPVFEKRLIASLGTHSFQHFRDDRFFLPYMDRLQQMVKTPVYQRFDAENIANITLTLTAKKGDSKLGEGIYLFKDNELKTQHLKLKGEWKVIGDDVLVIGETRFTLDAKTGILSAKADIEDDYDIYEIQLPKVLN